MTLPYTAIAHTKVKSLCGNIDSVTVSEVQITMTVNSE